MHAGRVVIIGAGIGGLAAAMVLASRGLDVTVVEKEAAPGGKMREASLGVHRIDAGPTVLTMRPVFEELFAIAGADLNIEVKLKPATVLARHAWESGGTLDLHADAGRSADCIGQFAGKADARGFLDFCEEAKAIYRILDRSFIRASKPSLPGLIWRIGPHRVRDLLRINPYQSLWNTVCRHMRDPRLRQLFARYATYCGSSPFEAAATLMLVAHVEQQGVWLVEGGMQRLARAMMGVATGAGAVFRFETSAAEIVLGRGRVSGVELSTGEVIAADAVVVNADPSAAQLGLLGSALKAKVRKVRDSARSLSALTWAFAAKTSGFTPARHTIFFSRAPYAAEFRAIFRDGALPRDPTLYVCAQDRDSDGTIDEAGEERLLLVVNAPACRKSHILTHAEIEQCETRTFALMRHCGLSIQHNSEGMKRTAPADFAALFPGSNGAIYGRASHGWMASFQRQSARSRIPHLYFAGGSVHPGPGVPMAALSGRQAAEALLRDFVLARRFQRVAMPGGILTPSAATASMD